MIKKSAEGVELLDDVSNYDSTAYENPAVTTDICVCRLSGSDIEVLLIKRKYPPYKDRWAIPGGFINKDKEGLTECAKRELYEETGVTGIPMYQFDAYGSPNRDPRMHVVTIAYYSIVNEEIMDYNSLNAGDDAKEYGWFKFNNLPEMAFDHLDILTDLWSKLKSDVFSGKTVFEYIQTQFTLRQLMQLHSAFGAVDAGNFRKYIKSRYNLKALDTKVDTGGRKARLYYNIGNR